jgi:hypothetical protein
METIRTLLREHGAAGTKAFLDKAICEEQDLLERRLSEIKAYLGDPLPQCSPPSEKSVAEQTIALDQEGVQKPRKVKQKCEPNSNRIHPIARAKAKAKAAVPPEPIPPPSEGEAKPSRGALKAEQRKKENAKRQELEAAGINPTSLLTKENLEKLLTSGKTFSQIAREDVGLREEDVSAAAKKHGLTSQKQRITGRENVMVIKEN